VCSALQPATRWPSFYQKLFAIGKTSAVRFASCCGWDAIIGRGVRAIAHMRRGSRQATFVLASACRSGRTEFGHGTWTTVQITPLMCAAGVAHEP